MEDDLIVIFSPQNFPNRPDFYLKKKKHNIWDSEIRQITKEALAPCSSTTGSADTLLSTKMERAS